MNITTVYTWSIPQGSLSLTGERGDYQLWLQGKDQKVISIPLEQVRDFSFLATVEKVEEVCDQYFPILTYQENRWSAAFHFSAVPGAIIEEETSQQNKSLGGFNFNFNTLENKRLINFSKDAAFYCRVISGMNMRCKCVNPKCVAFKQIVFIQKGMGSFNIAQHKNQSRCPACDKKIPNEKVSNLGFWNCTYEIEGKRADSADETLKKEKAGADHYTTFLTGDDCAWEYLQVTTGPLTVPAENKRGFCILS